MLLEPMPNKAMGSLTSSSTKNNKTLESKTMFQERPKKDFKKIIPSKKQLKKILSST